jgi:DNA topoisomerase-1
VVRVGRFGPYLQRNGETANLPDDMAPDELNLAKAIEMLEAPSGDRDLGKDPDTGLPVYLRDGRFGSYVQLGDAGDGKDKPKTQSVLKSMSADSVTLDDALRLLSLPRTVGNDPAGEPIEAFNGRYGPYIVRGKDRRSLEKESDLFTIGVDGAMALLAQPPKRGRQAAAAPLRELGADPVSGGTITLRNGRFGPYVTDGETNASLRTGDDPDSLTPERAHELLQLRRERGPAKGRGRKKVAAKRAKKAPARSKKTAKKKASKKSTPQKTTKKKSTKKKSTAKKTGNKSTAKKKAKTKSASADDDGKSSSKTRKLAAAKAAGVADVTGL